MIHTGRDAYKIERTFHSLRDRRIAYAIMDHHLFFPERYEGQDIDVLIDDRAALSAARSFTQAGWVQTRPDMAGTWQAISYAADTRAWILVDFTKTQFWVNYRYAQAVLSRRIQDKNGFFYLDRSDLLAWKIYKNTKTGRILEAERWTQIANFIDSLPSPVRQTACDRLSEMGICEEGVEAARLVIMGREICQSDIRNMYEAISATKAMHRVVRGPLTLFSALKRMGSIRTGLKRMCQHRSSNPYRMATFAVVGIDGSGKTTLCNKMMESVFRKVHPLHIVMRRTDPHVCPYRQLRKYFLSIICNLRCIPLFGTMLAAPGAWAVEALDYADRRIRYAIGSAWASGGFGPVLFERYPTDRLYGTMAKPRFYLERFFPSPSAFIYLDVEPGDSVERKSQDGHDLMEQGEKRENYRRFLGRYAHVAYIDADISEEAVFHCASEYIWERLRTAQGAGDQTASVAADERRTKA